MPNRDPRLRWPLTDLARFPATSIAGLLAIVLLAGGCESTRPEAPTAVLDGAASADYTPPALADGWRTAAAEDVGLARAPLARLTQDLREGREYRNVHALLIARDGRLVYEAYFAGEDERRGVGPQGHVVFDRGTRHDMRSVTKSVVSALVGIALGEGAIRSLDQPLLDSFPEHADLATPERRQITLQHALDMTAGLEWSEQVTSRDPRNDEVRMNDSADPVRYVLERPVVTPPGEVFNYSGGLSQLLAAVVERATGRPLLDYARSVLFDPLGITDFEWVPTAAGPPSAASGLRLRPRDMAKFGLLYQHGGRWQGRQVVPETWVQESSRHRVALADASVEFGDVGRSEGGYANQWWPGRHTLPYGRFDVLLAKGNGGQRIAVVPDLRLTVVHTAGTYNAGSDFESLLFERVLPWACGLETSCDLPPPRVVRSLAPGELRLAALTSTERARYVGSFGFEGRPLRVFEREGILRAELPWELGSPPVDLLPLGNHDFALGVIAEGVAVKQYWPGQILRFELVGGLAARALDMSEDGEVYETGDRRP